MLAESSVTPVAGVGADELTVLIGDLKDDLDAYLAARPGEGVRSVAEVVEFNRAHADAELAHFGQEFLEAALESGGKGAEGYAEARARCLAWAVDEVLQPAFEGEGAPEFLLAPAYAPAWKSDLAAGDHFLGGGLASAAPSIAGWPVLCLPMGLVAGSRWAWCSSGGRTARHGCWLRATPSSGCWAFGTAAPSPRPGRPPAEGELPSRPAAMRCDQRHCPPAPPVLA